MTNSRVVRQVCEEPSVIEKITSSSSYVNSNIFVLPKSLSKNTLLH